jgi:alkylation response protein AidB-like acyl-CoA dehydrogenase
VGTGSADAAELVAKARELRPLLAGNAAQGEAERRIPEESVQALADAGLFAVMVPRRYGGHEGSVRTLLEVSSAVAEGDGGAGWVVSLSGVCAWMTGLYSGKAQDEVFGATPSVRICGSGSPIGRGERVEGGWRISGRWSYISGSLHAQWAVLGFMAVAPDGRAEPAMALIPMSDCTLAETWFTTGLRASGSNTLVVEDVFVTEHRVLSAARAALSWYDTEYQDETAYHAAFFPTSTVALVGPLLGVARAALDHVRAAATSKAIVATSFARQADSAAFQIQLAEAASRVDTAHLHAFRAADDIDEHAARRAHPDDLTRARMRADAARAAEELVSALGMLAAAHGSGTFAEANPLHRMWQDVHIGAQHALLLRPVGYEVYGKALLGVANDVTLAI